MQRRTVPRADPRYKQLRAQNNSSVKKSRDRARREREETINSINQLEDDNQQLVQSLQIIKQEYEQLQILFKQHTGVDIDQMIGPESKSTTPEIPMPSTQPSAENSSKPVLTITTTEDKSTSNNELDVNNLDGSIVLINGVQYKIVGLDKA
ncbi:unnamed protein product [Adineta steineri]|uniref:BZIP domain-containing protein n=2 Tax=Adineta steineri TaxID=433720 RepID=A0A820CU90_9BILA|nr:unnamed protein product [Adineta steineri]